MMTTKTPVTTSDYRSLAQKRLPDFLFDYIDRGANDELTLKANIESFRQYCLSQRVLRDVSDVDTSTSFCGQPSSMPIALAPVGAAGMMARRGEVQAALAAQKAGIPFTCSTVGICSVEEVNQAVQKPVWFQLYMLRDRGAVRAVLNRVKAAGCNTLVFTVDLPVPGMRHQDLRNNMGTPWATLTSVMRRPRWAMDVGLLGAPHDLGNLTHIFDESPGMSAYKEFVEGQFDASVTWEDIAWLRKEWKGKLILKGLMETEDAQLAVQSGADGIIVSNHGGRQLDGVAASISKLPEIAKSVGSDIEVYMDGGVRSGIDVVKAVALGARGVLIGRPWVWAIAAKGETGLVDLLGVFHKEIEVAMALMGVNNLNEICGEFIT